MVDFAGIMESTGLGYVKLVAKSNKFCGEQHDWANWKSEMMLWLQVIDWLLPDDVQEALGCMKLVVLGPTAN